MNGFILLILLTSSDTPKLNNLYTAKLKDLCNKLMKPCIIHKNTLLCLILLRWINVWVKMVNGLNKWQMLCIFYATTII